ncbi:RING-type domain-containing protein [Fusarium sp. LHS14.1]|nr:RING-type domain-containing protein [Fusarium sp. LHS14.1]
MEPVGVILLVLFLFVLIVGPLTCVKLGSRNEKEKVYNPQPDQLDRARRKLSAVTTCSSASQRSTPSENADVEAVTSPSELGECPICIGPLIGPLMPEPAHTVGDDPPPTLGQASTAASTTQSRGEGEGTAAQSNINLDMEDDDILTLNTCGHSFHSKCLSSWFLIERHDCPVCRTAYYKGGPRRERTLTVPPFF